MSHWLDDRLEIAEVDAKGNVVKIVYGPTKREQLVAHTRGTCGALCSWCYAEATAHYEANNASKTQSPAQVDQRRAGPYLLLEEKTQTHGEKGEG